REVTRGIQKHDSIAHHLAILLEIARHEDQSVVELTGIGGVPIGKRFGLERIVQRAIFVEQYDLADRCTIIRPKIAANHVFPGTLVMSALVNIKITTCLPHVKRLTDATISIEP